MLISNTFFNFYKCYNKNMRTFKKIGILIFVLLIVLTSSIFIFTKNSNIKKEQKKKEFNYNLTWEQLFGDPTYRQMILYQILIPKSSYEYNLRDVRGNHVITNATIAAIATKEKQKITEAELASVTELFPLTPENEKNNPNYIPIGVKSAKEFDQIFFVSPFYYNCYLYNLTSIEVNTDKFTRELYHEYQDNYINNYPKCLNLRKLKINNYGSTLLELGRNSLVEDFEIINHKNDYNTSLVIDNNTGYFKYENVKSIKGKGNFTLYTHYGTSDHHGFGYHTNMKLEKFIIDGKTDDVVTAKETVAKTTETEIRVYQAKNPCKYTLSGDNLTKVEFGDSKTEICPEKSFIKLRDVPKLKNVEITSYAEFDHFDYENNQINYAKISDNRKYGDRTINLRNNPVKEIRFEYSTSSNRITKLFKELSLTVGEGEEIKFSHSTYGIKKTSVIVDSSSKEEYTPEEVNNLTPKSLNDVNGVFLSKNYAGNDKGYLFSTLGMKTLKVLELDPSDNKYKVSGIMKIEVLKTSMASKFVPQYIPSYPKKFVYETEIGDLCITKSVSDLPIINKDDIVSVEECVKPKKGLQTDGYRKVTFKDKSVKYLPLEYYGYKYVTKKIDCKDLYSKNESYIYGNNNKVFLRKYKKIYQSECIHNNEDYTCTAMYEDNCDNYKLENTLLDSKNYRKIIMKVEEIVPWGHSKVEDKLKENASATPSGIFNIHNFEPGKTVMDSGDYLYNETTQTVTKNLDWKRDEDKRVISYVSYEDETRTKEKDRFVVTTILRDTDNDGIPDEIDEDDDNDGISDVQEAIDGTDPKDKNSYKVKICYKITG